MKLLLDTHVLLWAAGAPERLSEETCLKIEEPDNEIAFSAASIWEIAIKSGLGRDDFRVDAGALRRGLLERGYVEIPVSGSHAAAVSHLPDIHRDPFDRILIAQAQIEAITLLTRDGTVAKYPGPIELI